MMIKMDQFSFKAPPKSGLECEQGRPYRIGCPRNMQKLRCPAGFARTCPQPSYSEPQRGTLSVMLVRGVY